MTALDQQTIDHLATTRTIDLTTIGRRSGRPSRIEIWWFRVDGRFIISGTPGPRDWLANIRGNPRVVISTPRGDFAGRAVEVTEQDIRRGFFEAPDVGWYRTQSELSALVAEAPMVEIHLD